MGSGILETLLSLGGIMLVQTGLTIRRWITERKNKVSNDSIKKELLELITQLKVDTSLFKDQINDVNGKLTELYGQNQILGKQYEKLTEDFKFAKLQIEIIEDYALLSSTLRTYEIQKKSFALTEINKKREKPLNLKLKSFLETSSNSMIKVFTSIMAYGLGEMNMIVINQQFRDKEDYLKLLYTCEDMGVDRGKIRKVYNTEKDMFITQLAFITEELKNGDRRTAYIKLCDNFLIKTISKIKNL